MRKGITILFVLFFQGCGGQLFHIDGLGLTILEIEYHKHYHKHKEIQKNEKDTEHTDIDDSNPVLRARKRKAGRNNP